jgi:hypothetical protein
MKVGLLLLIGVFLLSVNLSGVAATAGEHAMTGEEISQLIATAKTAADHKLLATYFDREASDAKAKAELHRQFEAIQERQVPIHTGKALRTNRKGPGRCRSQRFDPCQRAS